MNRLAIKGTPTTPLKSQPLREQLVANDNIDEVNQDELGWTEFEARLVVGTLHTHQEYDEDVQAMVPPGQTVTPPATEGSKCVWDTMGCWLGSGDQTNECADAGCSRSDGGCAFLWQMDCKGICIKQFQFKGVPHLMVFDRDLNIVYNGKLQSSPKVVGNIYHLIDRLKNTPTK